MSDWNTLRVALHPYQEDMQRQLIEQLSSTPFLRFREPWTFADSGRGWPRRFIFFPRVELVRKRWVKFKYRTRSRWNDYIVEAWAHLRHGECDRCDY